MLRQHRKSGRPCREMNIATSNNTVCTSIVISGGGCIYLFGISRVNTRAKCTGLSSTGDKTRESLLEVFLRTRS